MAAILPELSEILAFVLTLRQTQRERQLFRNRFKPRKHRWLRTVPTAGTTLALV